MLEEERQFIREYYIYLIIWKPLVCEGLQCVREPYKHITWIPRWNDVETLFPRRFNGESTWCDWREPTNEVGKTAVAVICTNSNFKEEMVGHVQQNISMIASIFYPCPIVLYTSLQLRNALIRWIGTGNPCDLLFLWTWRGY